MASSWAPLIAPRSLKIAPRSPKIALRSPQEAPRSGQDAPKASQERPGTAEDWPKSGQERPRGLLERSWVHLAALRSHLGKQNVCFSLRFPLLFAYSCFGPQVASEGILEPNSPQLGSSKVVKSGQETPKRSPRATQSGPRATQERPRAAQERPKSSQEHLKSDQRSQVPLLGAVLVVLGRS